MNQIGQYFHLIVIVLIVGSSAISWAFKKLQEQRARKQVADEIERRRLEMLRTGRDPGPRGEIAMEESRPEHDPESGRRAELARRRREQIEELRRRAAQRQAGQSGTLPTAPTAAGPGAATQTPPPPLQQEVVIQLPGGRVLRIPAPAPAGADIRPPQTARQGPKQSPRPPKPPRAPRPPKDQSARAAGALAASADTGESTTQRLVESRAAAAYDIPKEGAARVSDTAPLVLAGAPMTPEQWRRALIASELLAKPLSLRPPGQTADPLQGPGA